MESRKGVDYCDDHKAQSTQHDSRNINIDSITDVDLRKFIKTFVGLVLS